MMMKYIIIVMLMKNMRMKSTKAIIALTVAKRSVVAIAIVLAVIMAMVVPSRERGQR
jgi:hypothetical protein